MTSSSNSPFSPAIIHGAMEIELVKCECCGLREDCTRDYISSVKANFNGKWFCGLCSEAVKDERSRLRRKDVQGVVEEAIRAHMSFCRRTMSNPAVRVADGMRQMLRRRSGDLSKPSTVTASPKRFGRAAAGTSQVSLF
ncbi:hypothetical protein C4D60_Mb04t28390 [Musa balbisiana]|uniref:DUF1677 family protein n=1 Tax=Musa balbisiana TaxID=52838 RepID=A0A4V4HA35_MUSBA|nr:hypothetical protein C4D60_Mb04t28390 [Musa balbisiana]